MLKFLKDFFFGRPKDPDPMFEGLGKYKKAERFFFHPDKELSEFCNAPKNKIGIFFIWNHILDGPLDLFFIGAGGHVNQDGTTTGSLYDSIVNHENFIKPLNTTWPDKFSKEGLNLETTIVFWMVTVDEKNSDDPKKVQEDLIKQCETKFNRLPKWNKPS